MGTGIRVHDIVLVNVVLNWTFRVARNAEKRDVGILFGRGSKIRSIGGARTPCCVAQSAWRTGRRENRWRVTDPLAGEVKGTCASDYGWTNRAVHSQAWIIYIYIFIYNYRYMGGEGVLFRYTFFIIWVIICAPNLSLPASTWIYLRFSHDQW